jgi:hypothetical protein
MQIMVRAQLGLEELPEPTDASDALAVALCHLQAEQLERRFGVRKSQLVPNPRLPRRKPHTLLDERAPRSLRLPSDR